MIGVLISDSIRGLSLWPEINLGDNNNKYIKEDKSL